MKFYVPKLQIATLQQPQVGFRSKFGGLPWGLSLERWSRCELCAQRMSLLAQLGHDPPALDLGGSEHVLHIFQCQGCGGYGPGDGNDAIIVSVDELAEGLTQLPTGEELGNTPDSDFGPIVGELWIEGWTEHDDGLDAALANEIFNDDTWMELPESVVSEMFESRWRTKMGGIPYLTGNGPVTQPQTGYEFLFQLDSGIEFQGKAPEPDDVGGMVLVTKLAGEGNEIRNDSQEVRKPRPGKKKFNAPWSIAVDLVDQEKYFVEITNLGTDGTAYVFINRETSPPTASWFWNR